jgi:hypothetical protein
MAGMLVFALCVAKAKRIVLMRCVAQLSVTSAARAAVPLWKMLAGTPTPAN